MKIGRAVETETKKESDEKGKSTQVKAMEGNHGGEAGRGRAKGRRGMYREKEEGERSKDRGKEMKGRRGRVHGGRQWMGIWFVRQGEEEISRKGKGKKNKCGRKRGENTHVIGNGRELQRQGEGEGRGAGRRRGCRVTAIQRQ